MRKMISMTGSGLGKQFADAKHIGLTLVAALVLSLPCTSKATITDFTTWTLAQDPPALYFTGSSTAAEATLNALNGPVGSAVDIGFQSVNGATVGTSTSGYAFNPAADFKIAIDFDLSFISPDGVLAIGFGIGKDGAGADSAGVAMGTVDGVPQAVFFGAARDGDVNQATQFTSVLASPAGSLFVNYFAASGNVTVGASQTQGAATPSGATATYVGIENNWAAGDLLASFFLRSQGWNEGNGQAVFSNFRVLEGAPSAVPEPGSASLVILGGLAFLQRVRRNSRVG